MTTPRFLFGRPLRDRDRHARNRFKKSSYHALAVHHAKCLPILIISDNVSAASAALPNVRGFRVGPKHIGDFFVFSTAIRSKFTTVLRIMLSQFKRAAKSTRIRHDPEAGSYHTQPYLAGDRQNLPNTVDDVQPHVRCVKFDKY